MVAILKLQLMMSLCVGVLITAPTSASERLLEAESCSPIPAYESLEDFGRYYFDAKTWNAVRNDKTIECRRIRYDSDGLAVEGFLLSPLQTCGRKYPAIVYNRGGRGDFGRIDDLLLAEMRLLVRAGFVVAASNYRFIDERARRDEWGGADVNDVLNLISLLRSQPQVDDRNLYMLGLSRGGTMTYLALRRGASVNAAAVIAGPSDFRRWAKDAPFLVYGDDDYDGWINIWPDYETRKHAHFTQRSMVDWADEINSPLLILHSRTDDKVPVEHALEAAAALQKAAKPYELVIYESDGHSLPEQRADRVRHIVEFFRRHKADTRNLE